MRGTAPQPTRVMVGDARSVTAVWCARPSPGANDAASPSAPWLVIALPLLCALALACGGDGDGDDPAPRDCDAFANASCIEADRIVDDVTTLASPALTGRRAGTPGNDAAVDLVARRFEELGLRPVAGASSVRDPFPLNVWTASRAPTLRLGTASYTVGDGDGLDVIEFSGAGTVSGTPVVFAGHGIAIPPYDPVEYPACPIDPATGYDDFAGIDVVGKVVVVLRGFPGDDPAWRDDCPYASSTAKAWAAQQRGAAAVVFAPRFGASWTGATADHFRLASSGLVAIPAVQITRAALEAAIPDASAWQAAIDASYAPSSRVVPGLTAEVDVQGAIEERHPANVLAVVPGTDPVLGDEVVVIGAHLDHMGQVPFRDRWYPGADDNASGTAVLLEVARAVARSPTKPKRTLLFAAWNAEELGLIGSFEYVDAPAYPLADTVAAFSIDMVGDGSPGMLVYGGTEFPGIAATMEAGAAALALPDWPVFPVEQSYASDHAPFAIAGIPAVLFLTPQFAEHETYHTPQDTPEGVHRETLGAAAKLVWATVREYALGEEEPVAAVTSSALAYRAREPSRVAACFGPQPAFDRLGHR
jgi:aminopeptidase YwaD